MVRNAIRVMIALCALTLTTGLIQPTMANASQGRRKLLIQHQKIHQAG